MPDDALVTAINNGHEDIVRYLLGRTDLIPDSSSSALIAAARRKENDYMELLMANDRYFPTHDVENLLSVLCMVNINGPDVIWRYNALDVVLDIPEATVLKKFGSPTLTNNAAFLHQWRTFRQLRDSGSLQDGVPESYRIRSDELHETHLESLRRVVDVEILPCLGGWRRKAGCYHIVRMGRLNGTREMAKLSAAEILHQCGHLLSEEEKLHLQPDRA